MRQPNNRMREFVRLDVRGMDIAGTNIYQKTPPKSGRFREITPTPCCSAFELLYTPADVTDDTFTVTITCDGTTIATALVTQTDPTVTIDDVVELLYQQAKFVGKWSVEGDQILLQLNPDIARNCADPTDLAFTVTP